MDINDLKRKIKAQKSMSLELGKIRVDLIIPSDFDVQLQAVKAGLGEFQSTPLREGRLDGLTLLENIGFVSIHAPA